MEGKFWCFTLNNYSDEEYTDIQNFNCNYLIIGKEVGEEGTPHLQGYVEFKTNHKLDRLKKLSQRIHWEKRRGTSVEASDYCKKDGDYYEIGELSKPNRGKRTDIDEVRELVNGGAGMKEVMQVTNSFQAVRFAEKLITHAEKKRTWAPEVTWLWGPTGCGKTRRAFEETEGNAWISGRNLKWWDGYDAHENVIIDDFRADFCTFHELLRILDRYPYMVEIKGGTRQLLAKRIYITSCYAPDKVYQTREDIGQLLRRITNVVEIRDETEVAGNTTPRPYTPS